MRGDAVEAEDAGEEAPYRVETLMRHSRQEKGRKRGTSTHGRLGQTANTATRDEGLLGGQCMKGASHFMRQHVCGSTAKKDD